MLTTRYTKFYKLNAENEREEISIDTLEPDDTLEIWVWSTTTFGGELIEATEITVLQSRE
ncbi:hypothetical protein J2T14_006111 [Paenibacillus harenae]|nr:hypothetical protein [Paenibacillus harenae]